MSEAMQEMTLQEVMDTLPRSTTGKRHKAYEEHAALIAEVRALRNALAAAVELFEGDDECNEVGSDAWLWREQVRAALGEKP